MKASEGRTIIDEYDAARRDLHAAMGRHTAAERAYRALPLTFDDDLSPAHAREGEVSQWDLHFGPCPDRAVCHHRCTIGCFRVAHCGPLSGVYPGDAWPPEVIISHAHHDGVV